MKHIRYLTDNLPICALPSRLGHDSVVCDTAVPVDEPRCAVCMDLLLAYNLREYEREQRNHVFIPAPEVSEAPIFSKATFVYMLMSALVAVAVYLFITVLLS